MDANDETQTVFREIFDIVEAELNKNTVPKGDLNFDNGYFKPTIVALDPTLDAYRVGMVKNFLVTQEYLDSNKITIKRALGYSYVGQFRSKKTLRARLNFIRVFLEEIKMTIAEITQIDCNQLNWGDYYIKFGDVKDEEDAAVYGFEISSNCLPVVELGETDAKYKKAKS